ncbi:bifunctional inositol-1 monophosphatase/fructose-1,6-bisphosphatase [Palaeococcus pacificus DY20341]|uniref:fructose-bisphosphatase n=1 Tax=Palaeococcus pacificus DY20341 TaxID=1343739 RepID=A0A075LY09_9EURY|nr:bifunctional fructose-bisphosphatase/inositol-phosphate phosphatase [Palaeococcus pacificus]AIF69473.1 bifunctional inositol-1 monophosphatase/fructose-1,6-bisphosphatase [Palaeococcus pacificus DY20341]
MYEWNEIALQIAKEVEKEILPLFGKQKAGEFIGVSPSGDKTKLVDKIAENVILNYLEPLDVNIVSEEVGTVDKGSDYTVVVDPLDGSYNFIRGIPIFGFSFAVFKKDEPFYSMIYEFMTKSVYEAIPGKGAYLNGEPIKVREMKEGAVALNFYTRGRGIGILQKIKRTRVLGAIAVELVYLAKGATDGVVDIRNYVRPTDIAAGVMIAKEAGAIVTDDKGKELKFSLSAAEKTNIIAVNDERLLKMILDTIG